MKRILSLFLSVFMLVGVVSGVDFSAYADSLPKSANNESYTQIYVDQPVSFKIKNNDESKKLLFIPEKDGVFAFSSECRNSYSNREEYSCHSSLDLHPELHPHNPHNIQTL